MKLLIADDDQTVHASFARKLIEAGFDVLHAYDGQEALQMATEHLPGLILLDVTMPQMDGRTVCRTLKESNKTKHIKIVMLTAKDGQHDRVLGYELGADEYITKPCSINYLQRVIRKLTR